MPRWHSAPCRLTQYGGNLKMEVKKHPAKPRGFKNSVADYNQKAFGIVDPKVVEAWLNQ